MAIRYVTLGYAVIWSLIASQYYWVLPMTLAFVFLALFAWAEHLRERRYLPARSDKSYWGLDREQQIALTQKELSREL